MVPRVTAVVVDSTGALMRSAGATLCRPPLGIGGKIGLTWAFLLYLVRENASQTRQYVSARALAANPAGNGLRV